MSSPRGVSALLLLLTLFLTPGALGDCGPPERLDTAEVKGAANSYSVGSSVRYSCRPGYQLIAGMTPTARCLDSSTWSAVSEFCEGKRCPSLDLMNGRIDYLTDNRFGATANFRCNEGYRLIGAFSAKCVLSSSDSAVVWDKELPFCESIPCKPPGAVVDGSHSGISQESFAYGSVVIYKCNSGFSLIGARETTCTTDESMNGVWSNPPPECKVVRCLDPVVENGIKESGHGYQHTYGNTITYRCKPGYALHGSGLITCQANNSWSPPAPTCEKGIPCKPPGAVVDGSHSGISQESFAYGSVVIYKCNSGFSLIGARETTCTTDESMNGVWSNPPPECKGVPKTTEGTTTKGTTVKPTKETTNIATAGSTVKSTEGATRTTRPKPGGGSATMAAIGNMTLLLALLILIL